MCGIVGFVKSPTALTSLRFTEAFTNALLFDEIRGVDGTGIALIEEQTNKCELYKLALPAHHFIESRRYEQLLVSHSFRSKYFLGHNRFATIKTHDITHEDAHPFICDHIVLVHNGHVENKYTLEPKNKNFSIDSELLCYLIAQDGHLKTLEKAVGSLALVWADLKTGSLFLTTNGPRPLNIGKLENNAGFVFGSEVLLLTAACHRNGLRIDQWIKIKEKQLLELNPDTNSFSISEIKFGEPLTTRNRFGQYTKCLVDPEEDDIVNSPLEIFGDGDKTIITPTSVTHKVLPYSFGGPKSNGNASSEPTQLFSDQAKIEAERLKSSRSPVNPLLEKLHCKIGQIIKATYLSFHPYANKKLRNPGPKIYGTVIGIMSDDPYHPVFVPAINKETIRDLIVDQKPSNLNPIYEFSGEILSATKSALYNTQPNKSDIQEVLVLDTQSFKIIYPKNDTQMNIYGPNGVLLGKKEFLNMVKSGCHVCRNPLGLDDCEELAWTKDDEPICYHCFATTSIGNVAKYPPHIHKKRGP